MFYLSTKVNKVSYYLYRLFYANYSQIHAHIFMHFFSLYPLVYINLGLYSHLELQMHNNPVIYSLVKPILHIFSLSLMRKINKQL